jgi:CRP/FNR family transcriptional regulator
LSDAKDHRVFKKGDVILREGDESRGLFFIQNGVVKVQLNGVLGRPLILRLSGQGAHFGHRITPGSRQSPYSVVAVEDTSICFVSNENYQKLASGHAEFQNEIVASYLNELQQVEARTLLLAHKTVRQKVADALLKVAAAYRYQHNASGIRVHLDRQDMADLAGTTKEQVSKILFEFKEEGFLRFRAKHFKYMDTTALQRLVESC